MPINHLEAGEPVEFAEKPEKDGHWRFKKVYCPVNGLLQMAQNQSVIHGSCNRLQILPLPRWQYHHAVFRDIRRAGND